MTSTSALSLRSETALDGLNGLIEILESSLAGTSVIDGKDLEAVKQNLKSVVEKTVYVKTLIKSIKKVDEQREQIALKVIPREEKPGVVQLKGEDVIYI